MINLNIEPQNNLDLYIFGSSIVSDTYNDIDLAIIYDKNAIDIDKAINYRKMLKMELSEKFNCPIDILLLSKDEEIQTEFLTNAKHEIVYTTTK